MANKTNRKLYTSIAAAIAVALPCASTLAAAPNFSTSAVTISPEAPVEGDLVTWTLTARNSGPDAAEPVRIVLTYPASGYVIAVRGLDDHEIDPEQRRIESQVAMPAGVERRIELDVLTPRDSGGVNLTLGVRVSHLSSGTEFVDSKTVTVDTRVPASVFAFGGVLFTPASIAVLAWLAGLPIVWMLASFVGARRSNRRAPRFRDSPGALTVMLMLPLGFWAFFAAMAWRDYQSITAWRRAECTVVGHRLTEDTITSITSRGAGRSRTTTSTVYSPELAVRYLADGEQMYSSGYDTGSSLRIGGRARRERELQAWTIGTVIPCWYDPTNVRDVVVHHGFGGAYLFALIPLPLFALGVAGLRAR